MSDPDASQARIALITHPPEGAEAFARALVARRVAACVNLLPARSVYRWEGRVTDDAETLLIVKLTTERVPALERILATDHPYDVPELVLVEPDHVEAKYLGWLLAESRGPSGGESGGAT